MRWRTLAATRTLKSRLQGSAPTQQASCSTSIAAIASAHLATLSATSDPAAHAVAAAFAYAPRQAAGVVLGLRRHRCISPPPLLDLCRPRASSATRATSAAHASPGRGRALPRARAAAAGASSTARATSTTRASPGSGRAPPGVVRGSVTALLTEKRVIASSTGFQRTEPTRISREYSFWSQPNPPRISSKQP